MSMDCLFKNLIIGNSLVVQWLGLQTFIAEDVGSVLGRELRSPKPCSAAKTKQNPKPDNWK